MIPFAGVIRKGIFMAYIWINPVTAGMYEKEVLDGFLHQHGYQQLLTKTDWIKIVKEKYFEVIKESKCTVIDMRCPKAVELAKDLGNKRKFTFPEIHPILIHCSKEISTNLVSEKKEIIITTPCQALADMGNAMRLKNTEFIPWNRFLERFEEIPKGAEPKISPIPPGFFASLPVKTVSLSGEEEIQNFFRNEKSEDVQLVEMLYCKNGCHNGDGIRCAIFDRI